MVVFGEMLFFLTALDFGKGSSESSEEDELLSDRSSRILSAASFSLDLLLEEEPSNPISLSELPLPESDEDFLSESLLFCLFSSGESFSESSFDEELDDELSSFT